MNKKHRIKIIALSLATVLLSADLTLITNINATETTSDLKITIDTNEVIGNISPYIYGITDKYSIDGVTVNSIKQQGIDISTYNWEENFSNTGIDNGSLNGYELVEDMGAENYSKYALSAEQLDEIADENDIGAKFLTLPMLGKVSKDAYGVVSTQDPSLRYYDLITSIQKEISYPPDLNDDKVYSEEYLTYLTDKFGTSFGGGFDGYFLDSNPEDWHENFPFWQSEQISSAELVRKSVELSKTVNKIDRNAMVFGPSIEGLNSYANLKNSADWENHSGEYTWFIDYYLDRMRLESEMYGERLLDCLDLHYYPEVIVPFVGEPIYESEDYYANTLRTETPRILWDTSYTDSSQYGKAYKQFTPLISTLQASIRMYYPGTKLSFSEYNFGGGGNISGAIVQADVLGIFGETDIYMASLNPSSANYDYQKSAINLYTNYDGKGSSFGDISIKSSFTEDKNLSVYSSKDSDWGGTLTSVVINKSLEREKEAVIEIGSSIEYNSVTVYVINNSTSEIKREQKLYEIKDNTIKYKLEPYSVYLFEFNGDFVVGEETSQTEITTGENQNETTSVEDIFQSESETSEGNLETTIAESEKEDENEKVETTINQSENMNEDDESNSVVSENKGGNSKGVPQFLKLAVLILVAIAILGVIFIIFYDISKK